MVSTVDYKFSIPEEYCTPELVAEMEKYGYVDIQNEANFTGKQFRSFIITSVGFLGGCITIADKFLPPEMNQIIIIVDGVDYHNLTMNKVNEIVKMALEDQNQVAYFPVSNYNIPHFEAPEPKKD